ncbi:hypothetical protein ALC60_08421 [Trachymyrmex zeteki]|uniref:Secreted protein n=1 Tax=Mycetomoellerius zeteki TaxID=64791 RepID=A0A151WXQ7_9HYME|nr:hypothetical protein ALC60_08421 [Trachymyrmex zeteki]
MERRGLGWLALRCIALRRVASRRVATSRDGAKNNRLDREKRILYSNRARCTGSSLTFRFYYSHSVFFRSLCFFQNGEVRCDRKRCPRSLCNSIAHQMKRGEHVADVDDCCTAQCEHRARRHHRNNHHPARRHSMTPRELS